MNIDRKWSVFVGHYLSAARRRMVEGGGMPKKKKKNTRGEEEECPFRWELLNQDPKIVYLPVPGPADGVEVAFSKI
ncbi:hypothetical protein L484_004753 [Morus notabilis]|uniref:Uncharacterized protein n=1 Tax=Morus notabilis TaxID=981085 RepID=W9SXR8_9ROSA|nr:hypothetical protein L484_004753 [Morus notabilis]